jgi:acetolactate synthase-1/2/3 large subunit
VTGGRAVVETLAAHGVDTVFGIPGTHNLELYRWLRATGIRPITPRHEQGAGYAADGYAWVGGRPGVVLTTSGPGLLNAAAAAATSWAESRPVLLLSPGPPSGAAGGDRGGLHEMKDSSGALDRIVARSRRVGSPEEAADAVAEAFTAFGRDRPRPVHVEIPIDVLEAPWAGPAPAPRPVRRRAPRAEAVRAAAEVLTGAQRPLIVAGGGAVDAGGALRTLAEALGAPVVTTVNGKGVLDEAHPLAVGAAVRLRAVQEAGADAVLVVGSELGDADLWGGRIRGGPLLRLDLDPAQLQKNAPADVELLGDADVGLLAITAALGQRPRVAGEGRAAALRTAAREEALVDGAGYARVNAAVRAALPAGGVLTGDSSQVSYLGSVHLFELPAARRFCYMPTFATLGYGLPAAIGAALAAPDRPVACLLGDGALLFSVQELATAVELGLPIPVVVVDNGGYAEIREQQAARGIPPTAVDLRTPDLVLLATAMGARGVRTTDPDEVAEHVRAALAADGPTIIHLDQR